MLHIHLTMAPQLIKASFTMFYRDRINHLNQCCVFRPAFRCLHHLKAGWNTFFQTFSTFFVHFKPLLVKPHFFVHFQTFFSDFSLILQHINAYCSTAVHEGAAVHESLFLVYCSNLCTSCTAAAAVFSPLVIVALLPWVFKNTAACLLRRRSTQAVVHERLPHVLRQ